MKPTWSNVTVKLGDLKPWANNPKFSTKAQAKRLLASFEKFGQVQTVAVSPTMQVLDGHQRLSALLTIHGEDYSIDARQSNRELTDEERRELVVTLHAGAVGSWDWNSLSGWNAPELIEWGLDGEALKEWNNDANNLKEMLRSEVQLTEFDFIKDSESDLPSDCQVSNKEFPLSIVLTEDEFSSWNEIKRRLKCALDKTAFVKVCDYANTVLG